MAVKQEFPNKYVDNPDLWQDLIAAAESVEAATRTLEGLGYNVPGEITESLQVTEAAPVVTETVEAKPLRQTTGEQFLNWAMGEPDLAEEIITEEPLLETPGSIEPEKTAVASSTTLPPRPEDDEASFGFETLKKAGESVVDFITGDTPEVKEEVVEEKVAPSIDTKEDVKTTETIVEAPTRHHPDAQQVAITEATPLLGPDPYKKRLEVFTNVIKKYEALRTTLEGDEDVEGSTLFFFGEKENYLDLAKDIKEEIDSYEDSINAIAQEKPGEAISGANKFWAVIAAALGAGAASITGTPNFAMQIINKTIDQHLEKFKADRDFRVKSAERQQLNLITERGKMLQMAINAADSASASLKGRQDVEAKIATISGIREDARRALEKNDQDLYLAMETLFFKQRQAQLDAMKVFGERYIPGLEGVDSQGNPFIFSAAQGRTDKDVEKMKEYVQITSNTLDELDKLDALLYLNPEDKAAGTINPAIYLHSALSDTRAELNSIAGALELEYKEAYNLGANYSEKEQFLMTTQIPKIDFEGWDAWLGRIGLKSTVFRERTLDRFRNNYKTFTTQGMHNYGKGMDTRKKGSKKSAKDLGLKVRHDG